ncbi:MULTISPECIES: universal stress protein [Marinobacter]|uniref:Universal stress protein n=1 Tax=Marinobacter xiaoshiensis TaxID=3073652 RepID=A0ABU2HD84_9GAMM|nr:MULTISPECIES: universal stress protein [unclassified Marinobacter]MBK1872283.1 universal stress protein [Marinobacter sp. 1-3A]MBK1887144.1 universal stress protein [Marinobacter sp. DY40_1A1]MDS1308713.1 universal stress protein [Marinobacter sp. F60267]
MFKRILVAVDGSKTSLKALDKAIGFQKLMPETEIFILCVYKHHSLFEASLSIGRPADMDIPDKVLSDYAKEVVKHAKDMAIDHGATKVRGFVKSGRPSKVIVKFAQDKEADLIVVGTRGTHSDKDGMLLGSVSHRVASHAKCPVLVV